MAVEAVWCEPVSAAAFPVPQGKYREIVRMSAAREVPIACSAGLRADIRPISLNSLTGKFLPRSRDSRDVNSECSE